jgi:hypothetical protein
MTPPPQTSGAITWLSDEPVWVDQWPLTKEKLKAAYQLVQEQLQEGHMEPTNSPRPTPIFVIKEKSGKWRLLQDLRAINKTMQAMGPLHPGLPSPTAIPLHYHLILTDLKDFLFCFVLLFLSILMITRDLLLPCLL